MLIGAVPISLVGDQYIPSHNRQDSLLNQTISIRETKQFPPLGESQAPLQEPAPRPSSSTASPD